MSKFEAGDRVSVKGYINWIGGNFSLQTSFLACTIKYIRDDGFLECQADTGSIVMCHARQCRRLVKKKRRSVWVHRLAFANATDRNEQHVARIENPNHPHYIEFVEKKK